MVWYGGLFLVVGRVGDGGGFRIENFFYFLF